MMKTYLLSCTCTAVLLLVCVTDARFLDDEMPSRVKRQIADARMAEVLALLELERRLQGCSSLGCGLIDLERFYKRSWSDQRIAELKAQIALQGRPDLDLGHGQIDPYRILIKRTSSDQRIAELMALIALSRGGGGMIGHGRIDPNYVGRKKRDVSSLPIFKGQNAQRLLNKILRHSAEKL
ncbi:uncharacterized protein LOC110445285 [Mizuhopecten yessoensis]|uniref:uncharacterized protein LOC110445285 n=1 Tax=Mizuhopecten yessoensis TaxID=6573 RepID=UPI000B45B8C8|nr:uncharacterized protein LOC110445285 [Mizuhopecten yessoensis]